VQRSVCAWHSSCYKMTVLLSMCTTVEQRCVVWFLWAKGMAAKDIHKEMLPMYGEQVSKTNIESVGRWRLPRRQRILRRRFPGTCEKVGQVFKFVWSYVEKKSCLYVIISIHFFSITICNLLIDFQSYHDCLVRNWLALILAPFKITFVHLPDETEDYHQISCLYSQ
jgi:hypothetical protein